MGIKAQLKQMSKFQLFSVLMTYFFAVIFGAFEIHSIILLYPEYAVSALIAYFSFIGAPVGISIGFYCWRAKNDHAATTGTTVIEEE